MVGVQRGLLTLAAVAALAVPQAPVERSEGGGPVGPGGHRAVQSVYEPTQKEYYLAPDLIDVLRPGLNMTINGVTNVAPGQKPVVDFTITDAFGNPLDRTGAATPGAVTVRFTVATWDGLFYTNLIVSGGSPSRDTTGAWQSVSDGRYTYTFATALPTFDPTKPATLFGGGHRATTDILGKDYFANTFKDLIPATGAAATTWGVTTTARCNQCHDPLSEHGGNYFEVKACVLCHNPNNFPTRNANGDWYNGQNWFHQIHSGNSATIGDVTYPQDLRKCTTCHDPTTPMRYTWYTYPTRAACGSCHADVNFATGQNHSPQNLPQADDATCARCHVPQGDVEYDASVINAHVVPSDSTQLTGLNATILSATNAGAGQKATVTFKITNNAGTVLDPKPFGSNLNIVLGGPTTDYALFQPFRENASGAAFDGTKAVYTMTNAIPISATGTWTFSIECRQTVNLQMGVGGTIAYTEGAVNPIFNVSVDGSPVAARRVVVDLTLCNKCHYRLANLFSHGGQRIAIQECVMCHNPNGNDSPFRPSAQNPPEGITFKRMIHRIHTGDQLTQPYTIYGFNGAISDFTDVTYPGDRRDCAACHSGATYNLPLPAGTLPVVTLRDYFSPQGPGTAGCLGCHDNRDTAAHAYLNTTTFPGDTQPTEACGTCHGANGQWSPDTVHAR